MAQLDGVAPAARESGDVAPPAVAHEERAAYASQAELIFSLVGYAVGVGNVWRFPYLTYTYGGGAFLIPYGLSLLLMGVPLFVLELGMGQLTRRGTLGMWTKIGLPRWQGVGFAATMATFLVGLYYITILAWTIYYLGRSRLATSIPAVTLMGGRDGVNPAMLLCMTIAWILIWLVVFNGVQTSGKVVRALTLPNALTGLRFLFEPDYSHLADPQVWIHGAVQIFFSLGIGYGCIISFGSFGKKSANFVRDASGATQL
eukprot:g21763.t1